MRETRLKKKKKKHSSKGRAGQEGGFSESPAKFVKKKA